MSLGLFDSFRNKTAIFNYCATLGIFNEAGLVIVTKMVTIY